MDFAGARAALPSITRAAFGEACDVAPMAKGQLRIDADGSRAVQSGVMGRFDFSPEDTTLGGGRSTGERLAVAGEKASVSFDRAALSWLPQQGDRIIRANGEVYEVVRPGRDGGNVVIFWLSRA